MSDHYRPNYVEETNEEVNEDYSNDDLFNITSWGADPSFRELITMYKEGELIKPELQRKYVWDKVAASRFIESLLLGLPVPSIFLAEGKDETKLIIDGYQRIMTVYDFVGGIFSKDGKTFKLTNSDKINERWRGKAFNELSDTEQRKIKKSTIHAIIFVQNQPKDDDTSLFQIFERINTAGKSLTAQEIRNCVYQGCFNSLLFTLNEDKNWRILLGKEEADPRMLDMEFILRFFSLQDQSILLDDKKQISLKKHLNTFMGNVTKGNIHIDANSFSQVMSIINHSIGSAAFQNWSEERNAFSGRFSPTIFDAISIATAFANNSGIDCKNVLNRESHKELLINDRFIEYTTKRTTNTEHIIGRIGLASNILYGLTYEKH
ncbi:MAG: DUF262 domain-containing protein [Victivallales bacterium]|nr:DUF262 domain-containing protein [Victivallales bacterium]